MIAFSMVSRSANGFEPGQPLTVCFKPHVHQIQRRVADYSDTSAGVKQAQVAGIGARPNVGDVHQDLSTVLSEHESLVTYSVILNKDKTHGTS